MVHSQTTNLRNSAAQFFLGSIALALGPSGPDGAAEFFNRPCLDSAVVNAAAACLRWLDRGTPNLDESRRPVDWIIKEGNWASEVIRRVRALANKTSLEKVPLDINDVVREVIPLVQRELISHQVLLGLELAPVLPMILGDRVQLQQVIINLVMNGIEAMRS